MQVETGGGKRPDGGTSDQERLEYARAWVRDALRSMWGTIPCRRRDSAVRTAGRRQRMWPLAP